MATRIEPGLLRLFQWYAGICFGLLVLVAMANRGDDPPDPPMFPAVGIILFGLLLVVLVVPVMRRWLGRGFLPTAIVFATAAPILWTAANVHGRLEEGLSPNDALVDYWVPFVLLFVPFLITAWQYRYRSVLVFAVGSTFLGLMMIAGVFQGHEVHLEILSAIIFFRGFLFAFVGFFISKLVARQRDLRTDLEHAAVVSDQLATGRERNRLARELHDTLAHSMTGTAIQLEAASAVWNEDPDKARELVERALEGTRSGLGEARRAIEDLRASPIEDLGLAGAIRWLADDTTSVSGIDVTAIIEGHTDDVVGKLEHTTYRIAEESLTNAVRHSGAGEVVITLEITKRTITLTVSDDGVGFDATAVPDGRHGLKGMEERAEVVGGSVAVSTQPGEGTTVTFEVAR